jgi:hypothetical protein
MWLDTDPGKPARADLRGYADLLSEPHKLLDSRFQQERVFVRPKRFLRSSHVAVPRLLVWEHSLGKTSSEYEIIGLLTTFKHIRAVLTSLWSAKSRQ